MVFDTSKPKATTCLEISADEASKRVEEFSTANETIHEMNKMLRE
jgi:hypothetical protein